MASYVIIDTYSTKSFWYAFLSSVICRLLKIRYIPILHGGNLPERLDKSPNISKYIFNHSYINVSPSGYLKQKFEKKGYPVTLIPNNMRIHCYHFKKRMEIKPRLLWVRSFSSIYNPRMAIQAFNLLKIHYPETEMCMVGPDKDGSLIECKKLAKDQKSEHKIHFTGLLTNEEWINLSINYDIFISTTNFDNTPVSLMEAMALGLPVISTNVGGIPYLIEDEVTGLLTEKDNHQEMANKVIWIINHPEKAYEIAVNARKKAEQFDWNVIKHRWFSLLQ